MPLPILAALALALPVDTTARDTAAATTGATGPLVAPAPAFVVAQDTTRRRPRAIEYSDAYYTRLKIHRWGSYAMLPLFAGEYYLGDKLIAGNASDGTRTAHAFTAGAIGVLFGVNTITGAWNLYDSRHDPNGRTRRITHTALMLASDAGFVVTGVLAGNAGEGEGEGAPSGSGAAQHRAAALTSIGIATVGTAMMWLWK